MTERTKKVKMLSPVMKRNNMIAVQNRKTITDSKLLCINLISSPGAGKTTLLERLAERLGGRLAVIEGDVQTSRDANRVNRAGSYAFQIETGGSCHLDAGSVSEALQEMKPFRDEWEFLVIENVGNLICPSGYFLGEHITAGMLSLPEGDDKIMKYPALFTRIDTLLLNKIDLEAQLRFDLKRAENECRSLNPDVSIYRISAETSQGLDELIRYFESERTQVYS
ncbi:MAG: hydrogenase nickel incorporation protein HypB [Candidatus Sabulitectum sp.]|nr:hydrogenase nickel incorporation protein HypB [Candidatus Sabulitectum sp.]